MDQAPFYESWFLFPDPTPKLEAKVECNKIKFSIAFLLFKSSYSIKYLALELGGIFSRPCDGDASLPPPFSLGGDLGRSNTFL